MTGLLKTRSCYVFLVRCQMSPHPLLFRLPQATFLFSVVNWSPLNLGKGLVAPAWATALGWLLALSSVSLLPIWAIYALTTTPGTLQQVATRSNQRLVIQMLQCRNNQITCVLFCVPAPPPPPSASSVCAPLAGMYQRPSRRQPTALCCP